MSEPDILDLREKAKSLRQDILTITHGAQAGHPGGSLSAIDVMTALYFYKMNVDENNPQKQDRDRFVLSKGHCSPAMYAVLAQRGFIPKDELKTFRQINSRLQGHPELICPGIDFAGGSLGQGICFSVGLALAAKLDKKAYHVYTMIGDGEAQEGSVWEASMAAAHYKLDNFIAILDKNQVQETGKTEDVMALGDVVAKWEAFGFHVIDINGHDMDEIVRALDEATGDTQGKPVMIIARTIKGKGVSFMELNHKFHGKAPDDEQYEKATSEVDAIDAATFN